MSQLVHGPGVHPRLLGVLLGCVGTADQAQPWLVVDLWFLLGEGDPQVSPALSRANLDESGEPVTVDFAELRDLAANADQVINGSFLAQPPGVRGLSADLRNSASTIIQAVDSAYWRFWSRDQEALSAALAACEGAVLEPVAAIHRVR